VCSEERQSLSHVTYREEETFSGHTAGLKMVQSSDTSLRESTPSHLCLIVVNTARSDISAAVTVS
ncbi:hypothetical protein M9458_056694, partial [Cirrhinus mrigala]